jgi:hypothetical protein
MELDIVNKMKLSMAKQIIPKVDHPPVDCE